MRAIVSEQDSSHCEELGLRSLRKLRLAPARVDETALPGEQGEHWDPRAKVLHKSLHNCSTPGKSDSDASLCRGGRVKGEPDSTDFFPFNGLGAS
jgi:hypothetical protein